MTDSKSLIGYQWVISNRSTLILTNFFDLSVTHDFNEIMSTKKICKGNDTMFPMNVCFIMYTGTKARIQDCWTIVENYVLDMLIMSNIYLIFHTTWSSYDCYMTCYSEWSITTPGKYGFPFTCRHVSGNGRPRLSLPLRRRGYVGNYSEVTLADKPGF